MYQNPYNPTNYSPYMPTTPQYQPAPQSRNGLLWVQGIEGAKSFVVNPGESVLLMDSESNSFFIKSADASGMPLPLRTFDYSERTSQSVQHIPAPPSDAEYITREEFEARIAEITPKRRTTKQEGAEKNAE